MPRWRFWPFSLICDAYLRKCLYTPLKPVSPVADGTSSSPSAAAAALALAALSLFEGVVAETLEQVEAGAGAEGGGEGEGIVQCKTRRKKEPLVDQQGFRRCLTRLRYFQKISSGADELLACESAQRALPVPNT